MSDGIGATEDGNMSVGGEEDIAIEADVNHTINAALEGVWSRLHHDDDDAEDGYNDDESSEGEEQNEVEEENVEDGYDDWDDKVALSALDMLGDDFEHKSIANG